MHLALAIPPHVQAEIDAGALFVINDSGGKDSQAMKALLLAAIPRDQLLIVHADLEGEEWEGTEAHVRTYAAGVPVIIAKPVKTFADMVRHRRMFPSPQLRQCTSDLKRGPIDREVRRHLKANPRFGGRVVSCMGMRAQESHSRAKLATWKPNARNSIAGRAWFDWLPIFDLQEREVFRVIGEAGQVALWVYAAGMKRASCQFCIMACEADLKRAAALAPDRYVARVLLEREVSHTINMGGVPLDVIVGVPVPVALPLAA